MPITPTYPGVYVEELPSGVHTITGVSTSVTAFMGLAKRGPINRATHIFSFADYAQKFGGLDTSSQMSYAVSQFFLNGGSEAWIVRLALNASAATYALKDSAGNTSITVTAADEGGAGNYIQITVDDNSTDKSISPGTFKLTFSYNPPGDTADKRTEVYKGLSMDPKNSRFVKNVVNSASLLVNVSVDTSANPNAPAPNAASGGSLASGAFTKGQINKLPDSTTNSFFITLDGKTIGSNASGDLITLDTNNVPDPNVGLPAQLKDMAARIQKAVRALNPTEQPWAGFSCQAMPNSTLMLASGTVGAASSVTVSEGTNNPIAGKLNLLTGTSSASGKDPTLLAGGEGDPFDINNNPELFFPTVGNMLDKVDLFNLMCLPGVTDAGTLSLAIAYCQSRRAFLIIDAQHPDATPPGLTPDQMYSYITGAYLPKAIPGTYAAIYYPWVQSADPLNNGALTSYPPCGLIAGLYAATDSSRGVWKAPAGTNATLSGVQGLDYVLTNAQNGELNQVGVNCLRLFPIYGPVCWGSRTVSGADAIGSEYKYVPVRRTALYIEESLYRGLQWVVFEPNDEPLWAQIRLNVGAFMHDLFRKGAFQGQTPKDAYLVKCDSETTTQTDINHGIVNIIVGFAPLKPAEFVILQIEQLAGQIQV